MRPLSLCILFLVSILIVEAQEKASFRIMFYNTENFFDTYDDPLTDDNEFLPESERRWSKSRYYKKVNSVSKVIIAAGNPEPPAIVALCETESDSVLRSLVYSTFLAGYRYKYVSCQTADPRGIRPSVLYRSDLFRADAVRTFYPQTFSARGIRTRPILYCRFIQKTDTVHLLVNHWPSRRGGVLAGEDSRKELSGLLCHIYDSINSAFNGRGKIVVCGDFNSSKDSEEIVSIGMNTGAEKMVLLPLDQQLEVKGTYKFRGRWEDIDLIFASPVLVRNTEGISENAVRTIPGLDFLLIKDLSYPGLVPFATYSGYRYSGGFSDHLPVIADFSFDYQNPEE